MGTQANANEIRFLVPGGGFERSTDGQVERGVSVALARGEDRPVPLTAVAGQDLVSLQLKNGPELRVSAQTARDILVSQTDTTRSRDAQGDAIAVPTRLAWRSAGSTRASRGATEVALAAFSVVSGSPVTEAAALALAEKVDGQVDEGLYRLRPDAPGSRREAGEPAFSASGSGPLLVFVHGTFSSTAGGFGKLWSEQRSALAQLFAHYGADNLLAYDHRTLMVSPLENAVGLYKALPPGATVDLVTHSRGGLVGEVLARSSATDGVPFAADVIAGCPTDTAGQRMAQQMAEFNQLVATRKTRVRRMVRVACPAWGTLLAGKRLDVYLSVFKWLLGLAGLTPVAGLVEFLDAAARTRYDPEKLPGLAAMLRESPLLQVLNLDGKVLDSQLRVIAGDIDADSMGSWVKQLMADSFFWEDNDFVVQTSSMYGGAKRTTSATFFLDQSGATNHVAYFRRENATSRLVTALISDDEVPPDFRPIGPRSAAGADSSGVRGSSIRNTGDRPLVIVLPGIMGSHLKRYPDGPREWLDFFRLPGALKRLALPENDAGRIAADGSIGMYFNDLHVFLNQTHDVIDFSYDWRLGIDAAARRLGEVVKAEIARRKGKALPVSMVAHSMGGLVARALQFTDADAWGLLTAQPANSWRIVFLGTPHAGSYAPMQATTGDAGTFVSTAQSVGTWPWSARTSRQISAEFVGLLQIQKDLLDPTLALGNEATWQANRQTAATALTQISEYHSMGRSGAGELDWGIPPQAVLDQALAIRRQFDAQLLPASPLRKAPMCIVLGQADATPTRLVIDQNGYGYANTAEGDGRVTWDAGRLLDVPRWIVDVEHGSLADAKDCFQGYLDLLLTGETSALEKFIGQRAKSRGRGEARGSGGGRGIPDPLSLLLQHAGGRPEPEDSSGGAAPVGPVTVSVTNGDLRFVEGTLMLGHFDGTRLVGSEREVDQLFGGLLERSLRAGLYPTAVGESDLFSQPDPRRPGLRHVLVAGLGLDGHTRPADVRNSVERAVLRYLRAITEKPELNEPTGGGDITLHSLCMGSGSGIAIAGAMAAICSGVLDANESARQQSWRTVTNLCFAELFANRAREMLIALRQSDLVASGRMVLQPPRLIEGHDGLQRPTALRYRSADYDLISVQSVLSDAAERAELESLEFSMWSQRSRSEIRGKAVQARLVQRLIATAEAGVDETRDIDTDGFGATLFKLLVPLDLREAISASSAIMLDLDRDSAAIPWELIDSGRGAGGAEPIAVRAPLLRRLRTADFRPVPVDAREGDPVLVIGAPRTPPGYAPLAGARAEAEAVAKVLETEHLSLDESALAVTKRLFSHSWRVVHVAGHGKLADAASDTGIVLDGDCVLGPREIQSMDVVPELVFVNCCHLGDMRANANIGSTPPPRNNRPLFAASVAQELIQMGVRCVVAAGWAVDDRAASHFANTFYRELRAGRNFRDAVHLARKSTFQLYPDNNTWAAYQCYGDPYWQFATQAAAVSRLAAQATAGDDVCSAEDLIIALAELSAKAKRSTGGALADIGEQLARIEYEYSGADLVGRGDVAEAFAATHQQLSQLDKAEAWLARAIHANDGRASMRAQEQYYNTAVRATYKRVREAKIDLPSALIKIDALAQSASAFASAYGSPERWRIAGAAYKRLAMIQARTQSKGAKPLERTLSAMSDCYTKGCDGSGGDFYPLMQLVAIKLVQVTTASRKGAAHSTGVDAAAVLSQADAKYGDKNGPDDFWRRVGRVELALLGALTDPKPPAAAFTALAENLRAIRVMHRVPHQWDSVADNLRFLVDVGSAQPGSAAYRNAKALRSLLAVLEEFGTPESASGR